MNHARIDLCIIAFPRKKKLDFMFRFVCLVQQHKQILRKVIDLLSQFQLKI